jgi:branched-chain amino acid transport system substrate-binding protein
MKKIKIILVVVFAILVIGFASFIYNKNKDKEQSITIAVIMPMSGELAIFGDNVMHGVELALEQSGLDKNRVRLVSEDTAGFTSNGALSAWRRAIEVDHADIVFGPFGPAQTLTIASSFNESDKDVSVISISNCDDRFVEYQNIFCIYPGINEQIASAMDFMTKKGWKNIYLLTENSEFGLQVENLFKDNLELNLIGSEKVVPNSTRDLRTPILKALSTKPDAVFSIFSPNEGMILLRQYPVFTKEVPLLISTDINSEQLTDLFGNRADNIFFAARLSENYDADFSEQFKEKYGALPDYFAALSHSAASLIFDSFAEGQSLEDVDVEIIQKTLEKTAVKDFSFKSNRKVSVPLDTYIFTDKTFVEVTP